MKPEIEFHTFGCKVNTYDTGLLESRFRRIEGALKNGPSIHIVNTCAVTAEATTEALRQIRKLKRMDPSAKIVVTGCSAQVDTERFVNVQEVDLIVANSHKGAIETIIQDHLAGRSQERLFKSNIFRKADLEEGGGLEDGHTRSFLKIQDGCNSFCTFCVIPYARGTSRSLSIQEITTRVNDLLAKGIREIVLTGVHIGDYEFGLENLVEEILLKTRVPRLRLTSLEPIELNDRLLDLYQDPRLCPHFHMSIQSAQSQVLHRMKRKYSSLEVEKSLRDIACKVPSAFVGMDVIVGFPGEGEAEFTETYERLAALPWTRIHVFPYSERPGTMAVKLDGKVPSQIIQRRADQLRNLSLTRVDAESKKQIGSKKKALILNDGKGLSRDFWQVRFRNERTVPSSSDLDLVPGTERAILVTDVECRNNGEPFLIGDLV